MFSGRHQFVIMRAFSNVLLLLSIFKISFGEVSIQVDDALDSENSVDSDNIVDSDNPMDKSRNFRDVVYSFAKSKDSKDAEKRGADIREVIHTENPEVRQI